MLSRVRAEGCALLTCPRCGSSFADAGNWGGGFGRSRQTRLIVGFDVDLALEDATAELQKLGTDALAAPAFKCCLADGPVGGELAFIEVHDFHLGLLPNELAGVHEGVVPPPIQGNY